MSRKWLSAIGRLLLVAVLLVAFLAGGCKNEPRTAKLAGAVTAADGKQQSGKQDAKPPKQQPKQSSQSAKPSPKQPPAKPASSMAKSTPVAAPPVPLKKPVTILVVGADASHALTDVNILLSLDPATQKIAALWAPRDTRVSLPGRGFRKINAAHVYGGIALLKSTVSRLTGISPQYYVRVDFGGFSRIIDLLGGVDFTVSQAMRYLDRRGGLDINIKPGKQHFDGATALKYVRFRADGRGDIGRIGRQKGFVVAVFNELVSHQAATLSILSRFLGAAKTDIPEPMARALIEHFAKKGSLAPERLYLLPGEARYIGGISYWVPDKTRIARLTSQIPR